MCEALGLSQLKGRKWHVQRAVAIRGEGLYEGLDWYVSCHAELGVGIILVTAPLPHLAVPHLCVQITLCSTQCSTDAAATLFALNIGVPARQMCRAGSKKIVKDGMDLKLHDRQLPFSLNMMCRLADTLSKMMRSGQISSVSAVGR